LAAEDKPDLLKYCPEPVSCAVFDDEIFTTWRCGRVSMGLAWSSTGAPPESTSTPLAGSNTRTRLL